MFPLIKIILTRKILTERNVFRYFKIMFLLNCWVDKSYKKK